MAPSKRKRDTPRPATDPGRWRQVTGGLNIRRKPEPKGLEKVLSKVPLLGGKLAGKARKR
jgi:hypothetical protein